MKSKPIKVSVITPCYNSERTIRETIESVLYQTYPYIEYIIVDGKSSDETMKIVKEYEHNFRGRLRYVSEKDTGIYNAMNKGIRMATGGLIGIINSDDYYELDTVEKIVSNLEDKQYQVLYGYVRLMRNNRVLKVDARKHTDLDKAMIAHPTCFLTRDTYIKYGMFLERFKIAADYELMLRLREKSDVKFVLINDILANFRLGGSSSGRRTIIEKTIIRYIYRTISLKEGLELLWKICTEK